MPSLLRPHAQRTVRLQDVLQQLGLALGGEAGARLSNQLGVSISPDSLLRLVREVEPPVQPPVKIIGIDNWAYKRRLRYGTLICDLETRRPVDLLPDRSVQTVCTWLEQHPEVEVSVATAGVSTPQLRRKALHKRFKWLIAGIYCQNLVEALTHLLARNRNHVSMVPAEAEDGKVAGSHRGLASPSHFSFAYPTAGSVCPHSCAAPARNPSSADRLARGSQRTHDIPLAGSWSRSPSSSSLSWSQCDRSLQSLCAQTVADGVRKGSQVCRRSSKPWAIVAPSGLSIAT